MPHSCAWRELAWGSPLPQTPEPPREETSWGGVPSPSPPGRRHPAGGSPPRAPQGGDILGGCPLPEPPREETSCWDRRNAADTMLLIVAGPHPSRVSLISSTASQDEIVRPQRTIQPLLSLTSSPPSSQSLQHQLWDMNPSPLGERSK